VAISRTFSEDEVLYREVFLMGWLARGRDAQPKFRFWCTLHGVLFEDLEACSCRNTLYVRALTTDEISMVCAQVILDGTSVIGEYNGEPTTEVGNG